MGPTVFKIITIIPLNIVTQNMKTSLEMLSNTMLKYLKLRTVTQTLFIKPSGQIQFFFWVHIFQHLNIENCGLNLHTKQALIYSDRIYCKDLSSFSFIMLYCVSDGFCYHCVDNFFILT